MKVSDLIIIEIEQNYKILVLRFLIRRILSKQIIVLKLIMNRFWVFDSLDEKKISFGEPSIMQWI